MQRLGEEIIAWVSKARHLGSGDPGYGFATLPVQSTRDNTLAKDQALVFTGITSTRRHGQRATPLASTNDTGCGSARRPEIKRRKHDATREPNIRPATAMSF
jgi:hypothetical protein